MIEKLLERGVILLPQAGISLLLFLFFWLMGVVLQRIIRHIGERGGHRRDVFEFLARTTKIVLVVFGAVTALGTLGIDVSALVAGLGLTGFALGFALRDILSNILAGILLLTYRPFRRGDRVAVAGFEGIVADLDLRYTTLQTDTGQVLIPNATLFTNAIAVLAAKEQ